VTYIVVVGIKSGPNWGNSDQISRMKIGILRDEGIDMEIVAVNGCIYGRDDHPLKIDPRDAEKRYFKLCGQAFWDLISNDPQFYQRIVVPIDKEAKKKDENFRTTYTGLKQRFGESRVDLMAYGRTPWS
jgi:hypothetical protein